MKNSPFFSVVIPVYNKSRYISETINSVLSQTFKDFEIVVIDDRSTDDSLEVINNFHDSRIRILQNPENFGIAATRNIGMRVSHAEWIALLDADDVWFPDYLSTIHHLMKMIPGSDAYCTSFQYFDESTREITKLNDLIYPLNWFGVIEDYCEKRVSSHLFFTSSIVINQRVLDVIGGFPDIKGEDTYFWGRMSLHYSIAFINMPKVNYRINIPHQTTRSKIDVSRLTVLLEAWDSIEIPHRYKSSFGLFKAHNYLQLARDILINNNDGQATRYILKNLVTYSRKQKNNLLWLSFWSYFPKLFGIFVKIKDRFKLLNGKSG